MSFAHFIQAGGDIADEVNKTATHLEHLLRQIHGGRWSIHIDHDAQFVAVSRDFDRPEDRIKPKPEVSR